MKCRDFAALAHELASRAQLDPAVAAIARAHAEVCPACACCLAEAEHLAGLLKSAAADTRLIGAPRRLEAELLESFRRETAARGTARSHFPLDWRGTLGWAAAAATLAFVVFLLLPRAPDRRPSPVVRTPEQTPVIAKAVERATPQVQSPLQRPVAKPAPRTELASEFVPVPFSGSLAPGDSAMIVRVQVPRAALAELGYPVDETQGSGMVQADLIVGEDGWPHAIRIVR